MSCVVCDEEIGEKIIVDGCGAHKMCLPGMTKGDYCGNCKDYHGSGKLNLNEWWPQISNYGELIKLGHKLTRETKSALLYTYWFLRNSGLPKDVVKMIMPNCILPHGPITNTQNGLSFSFLLEKFETDACTRCGYMIFTNLTNYPITNCKNGACPDCGQDSCGDTCELDAYSQPIDEVAPYIGEIAQILELPYGLNTIQTKTRIRHILQFGTFSPEKISQLFQNLKYFI
jgi:hypothetical protein